MDVNLVSVLKTWGKEGMLLKMPTFRLVIESLANGNPSWTLPFPTSLHPSEVGTQKRPSC